MIKLLLFLQFALGNILLPHEDTLKIVFAGDIMQHKEQLATALRSKNNPNNSGSYDYSSYFKYLAPYIDKYDIKAANMETTFSPENFSGYPVFTSPKSLLEASATGGFNLFCSANNHICDKGRSGLEYTINLYHQLKLNYIGIEKIGDSVLINNQLVLEKKGFKIAFLNYTYGTNGIKIPGGYRVNILDSSAIIKDIEKVAELNPDIIIAVIHWGSEYILTHSPSQEKWVRLFNRLGVKYIIGSHPHVPQEIMYKKDINGYITEYTAYSLGNCISNMTAPNTRIGLLVMLNFVKRDGIVKLLLPETEYIWTARPGEVDKNYTILPVSVFKDKPQLFSNRAAYNTMMNYYINISNDR